MKVTDTVTGATLESSNPEVLAQWERHKDRYVPEAEDHKRRKAQEE